MSRQRDYRDRDYDYDFDDRPQYRERPLPIDHLLEGMKTTSITRIGESVHAIRTDRRFERHHEENTTNHRVQLTRDANQGDHKVEWAHRWSTIEIPVLPMIVMGLASRHARDRQGNRKQPDRAHNSCSRPSNQPIEKYFCFSITYFSTR